MSGKAASVPTVRQRGKRRYIMTLTRWRPTTDVMLNIANTMRSNTLLPPQAGQTRSEEKGAISNLQQNYCGILHDMAVKSRVK